MIDSNNFTLNISKNYIDENNLKVEDVTKQLDCSTGFIEMLLDYEKHTNLYEEQLKISMDFIIKISNTYNVNADKILKKLEIERIAKISYSFLSSF